MFCFIINKIIMNKKQSEFNLIIKRFAVGVKYIA